MHIFCPHCRTRNFRIIKVYIPTFKHSLGPLRSSILSYSRMSFSPELRLADFTKVSHKYNGMWAKIIICQCHSDMFTGNLSVNDGRVRTYIEEEHVSLPPPTICSFPILQLHAECTCMKTANLDIMTLLAFLNSLMKDFVTFLSFLVNRSFTICLIRTINGSIQSGTMSLKMTLCSPRDVSPTSVCFMKVFMDSSSMHYNT